MAERTSAASAPKAGRSDQTPPLQHDDDKEDPKGKKPMVKKRTKTGCLTCRKRRIKCDENKPRCKNCIKSKRECEGYNQRVVFKDPMGAQHGHFAPPLYSAGTAYLGDHLAAHHAKPPAPMPLQAIAPKPSPFDFGQPHMLPRRPQNGLAAHDLGFGHGPIEGRPSMPNPLLGPDFAASQERGEYLQDDAAFYNQRNLNVSDVSSAEQRLRSTGNGASNHASSGAFRDPESEYEEDLSDEEMYMAESDDEPSALPDPKELVSAGSRHMFWPYPRGGAVVRTFSAFAQEQALAEYMDYAPNSELRNQAMRTIFMHFVSVTGPSMSLYERDPTPLDGSGSFEGNAELGHNLFSYTFPVLALNHPGLLHAIMAIASLQIAKLQGTPATAALKHYHWSIRRIAKNVKSPLKRTKLSTLAATLLLAYFEVWSSDHSKWCSHLFGARLLFREIALRDMSRVCLPVKRMKAFAGAGLDKDVSDLDYDILSLITGTRLSAEDYGLQGGQLLDERCLYTTDRDVEQYDILRDLFWWYAKMDVYQSILGGTKLFMDYDAWTQCPPRAPLSNFNAIYGTYDHLILLLGRLASFASRDLSRKRKANRPQSASPSGGSPPQFPGIVPTHGKFNVPLGFSPPMEQSPNTDSNDEFASPQTVEAAEHEWESIRQGFEALESCLGAQFKPLNSEYTDRKETPFGSALQYRTYSVAGIWMNYYMGLIHLYRSRPNMPPAAMQAAQMAAPSTAGYAIQIGRIAAGLADDSSRRLDVSTTLAAAFIESCFCLFVAAVQLQNSDQRTWVIQRMFDIARLTGWQSAMKIAIGCETAWLKAHQLGHGPAYKRPEHLQDVPISVWMMPRRLDQRISELDGKEEQRLVLVRSEQTSLAFGLLGVEKDLDRVELEDDD
ncbi:hypothetical protein PLICBS_000911 [Purpureocillium lilacinum]|uniref:uncharacterized protein n=1 Tax=Purpureocillium lilacinum TaxID=33203 RepID=UPI002084C449|nr:hypothetical protein PLICBS_000911 [Purpureocillium lilacinum]